MLCKQCKNEVSNDEQLCEKCGDKNDGMAAAEQNPFAAPAHASTGITPIKNADVRASARQQLKGAWGKMILAFFVYSLLVIPIPLIFADYRPIFYNPFQNPIADAIFNIIVLVISGAFSLGIAGLCLKRIRGEEIFVKNIFDGFKRFLSSFLAMFFFLLFISLWSLLLIIPGIIKMFGYYMVFFIMYDNPDIKPLEALKRSQDMMIGYKGKLFMLHLSFLGWFFLGCLTLGIGFLWIMPYFYLSLGNFYETLKQKHENAAGY